MVHRGLLERCLFRSSLSKTPTQELSAANDTKDNLHHPNTVFTPALSRITQENKDKARRGKMNTASFSLAPSP